MAILLSEDFNRPDEGALAQPPYTPTGLFGNHMALVGNKADRSGDGQICATKSTAITWPNDYLNTMTFTALADSWQAVMSRVGADYGDAYFGGWDDVSFGGVAKTPRIWKSSGGVFTSLGTGAGVIIAGDIIKFSVQGTTLKLYVNGVELISVTDATRVSGEGGFGLQAATFGVGRLDVWVIEDFAVGWSYGEILRLVSVTIASPSFLGAGMVGPSFAGAGMVGPSIYLPSMN